MTCDKKKTNTGMCYEENRQAQAAAWVEWKTLVMRISLKDLWGEESAKSGQQQIQSPWDWNVLGVLEGQQEAQVAGTDD